MYKFENLKDHYSFTVQKQRILHDTIVDGTNVVH